MGPCGDPFPRWRIPASSPTNGRDGEPPSPRPRPSTRFFESDDYHGSSAVCTQNLSLSQRRGTVWNTMNQWSAYERRLHAWIDKCVLSMKGKDWWIHLLHPLEFLNDEVTERSSSLTFFFIFFIFLISFQSVYELGSIYCYLALPISFKRWTFCSCSYITKYYMKSLQWPCI